MKKFLLFAFLGTLLFGCTKKGDDSTTTTKNTLTATIDNVAWTPTDIGAVSAVGTIIISGSQKLSDKTLGINILTTAVAGTYDCTSDGQYTIQYTSETAACYSKSGKIVVTSHNKTSRRIEGTFDVVVEGFGVTESHTITGTFAVTY